MKVLLVFRDPKRGGKSVEEIYKGLFTDFQKEICIDYYSYQDDKSIICNVRNIYSASPSIVHITSDLYWICLFLPNIKCILTIHDIGRYLGLNGFKKWLYKQLYFYWPSIHAKAIITVSNFTRTELSKVICKGLLKNVYVIHNPVPSVFMQKSSKLVSGSKSILQVGTSVHKNLDAVIVAMNGLPYTLNIIGSLSESQKELLYKHQISYNVYEDISYEDVFDLYLASNAIIFISSYEGFGMPVIEAQAIGRPVITSLHSSLPEIGGKGAHYIKQVDDTKEVRDAITKVLEDIEYQRSLVQKGFENVIRFRKDKVVKEYLNIYKRIYSSSR